MNSKKSSINCYFFTISFMSLGLLTFYAFTVLLFILTHEDYNFSSLLLGIITELFLGISAIFLFFKGGKFYWILSRKYLLNADGIIVKYCNGRHNTFLWEDIVDICVCDVNHNYGGGFDIVIRVGLKSEENGPLCSRKEYSEYGYEQWRHEWYLFSNYRKVIYLDYSEQRLVQVLTVCKQRVVDRRTKKGKNIYIHYWDSPSA